MPAKAGIQGRAAAPVFIPNANRCTVAEAALDRKLGSFCKINVCADPKAEL
jgi:hypothetical protein